MAAFWFVSFDRENSFLWNHILIRRQQQKEENDKATVVVQHQIALRAPDWLSDEPLIRSQELEQWDWESRQRYMFMTSTSKATGDDRSSIINTIRSDFHRRIQEVAESPVNQELQSKANAMLKNATEFFHPRNKDKIPPYDKNQVFDDIIVAVELNETFLTLGPGRPGQRNNIVGGQGLLQPLNSSCVVYGAGIAYETSFEVQIARDYGCAVHAFDCTMTDNLRLKEYLGRQKEYQSLAFHPWCIGEELKDDKGATLNLTHSKNQYDYEGFKGWIFNLDEIMEKLGHDELDILKFDIEGFEWELLEVLLRGKKLPMQLQFELHTKGANRGYVPEFLTHDKEQYKVASLFLRLFDLGYRIVTKELNHGDFSCAEFVLYRFYDEK